MAQIPLGVVHGSFENPGFIAVDAWEALLACATVHHGFAHWPHQQQASVMEVLRPEVGALVYFLSIPTVHDEEIRQRCFRTGMHLLGRTVSYRV